MHILLSILPTWEFLSGHLIEFQFYLLGNNSRRAATANPTTVRGSHEYVHRNNRLNKHFKDISKVPNNIIFSKSNIIYATNDNDDNNDNHGGFGRVVEKSFTSSHSSIIGNKFGLDTWCLCKLIW